VDVGGHVGETVQAAVDPIYGFDIIYSLEPVRSCALAISALGHERVAVLSAGLSNECRPRPIIGAGSEAGSVYDDFPDAHERGGAEVCSFLRASEFFGSVLLEGDRVWVKMNCEGSEVAILEDLLESGIIGRIQELLVCFDARKIPRLATKVPDLIERIAKVDGLRLSLPEQVMFGTGSHFGAIKNWLDRTGARRGGLSAKGASLRFHVANVAKGRHVGFYKLKIVRLLPPRFMSFYYERLRVLFKH